MSRVPFVALFGTLLSGAFAQVGGPSQSQGVYLRPVNDDCISRSLGLSELGSTGQYFPSEYLGSFSPGSDSRLDTELSEAKRFDVTYYDTYKVVENKVSNRTYVLYECGSDKPDAATDDNVPGDAVFFQVPLTSLSVSETVPFAFLEALGVADRVHDVSPYVTSACGQKLVECSQVAPSYADFLTSELNETALDLGRRVSDAIILGSAGSQAVAPVLAFDAEDDPGLLNRAEWIKYLSLFFNKEKEATVAYDAIVENYNEVKKQAAEAAAGAGSKPVIAWVTHFEYDGEEHFDVSFAAYKKDLVEEVSGELPAESAQALVDAIPGTRLSSFSNSTVEFAWDGEDTFESKEAARAAFLEFLSTVDAVVDETYSMDPMTYDFVAEYGFGDAAPADLLVYRLDGKLSESNGYDWFESSFVRPDLALSDVQRIADSVRQGKNKADSEFTWLRNVEETPVVVKADECSRITTCGQKPATICPFVKPCSGGTTALLLEDDTCDSASKCCYESCAAVAGASSDAGNNEDGKKENAAQMAAPAVILVTLLVVFVEALLHLC